MFWMTLIVKDIFLEEDKLHGLHARQIWILWTFFLWRHLKTLVNVASVGNERALHYRTTDARQTICNYPGILERTQRSTCRGVRTFEYLPQLCCFTYNSQIKRFCTDVEMDIFPRFSMRNWRPKLLTPFSCIFHQRPVFKSCMAVESSDHYSPVCQAALGITALPCNRVVPGSCLILSRLLVIFKHCSRTVLR
jgi:hypothetical protein